MNGFGKWLDKKAADRRAEDRTAKAAQRIERVLQLGGLMPSGIAESGNVPDGFNIVVEIDGHDYEIEIVASYTDDDPKSALIEGGHITPAREEQQS